MTEQVSTQPTIDPRRLLKARIATFAVFAVNGLLLAVWVVSIPDIQRATRVSEATIGTLLLLLGGAGFIGMQLAGAASDRFGSKPIVLGTGILTTAAVFLPALAHSTTALALALALFGFALGAMDVAMNAHAVGLERRYRRAILAAFHAFFSVGGAIGAFAGAAAFRADFTVLQLMGTAGVLGAVTLIASYFLLLPPALEREPHSAAPRQTRKRSLGLSKPVMLLGATAFLLMLAEGVANDWSALQIQDRFDATTSTAAVGYGIFAVTMTLGRFSTDHIVRLVGPGPILLWGSLTAAVALAFVSLAPTLWLNYVGWALLGIGLSGCVAQLFTASGNLPGINPGVAMSRVVGMGYLGILAGPAVIGWLTHVTSLSTALLLPALGCIAAYAMARQAAKYLPDLRSAPENTAE